jgi:hypothetical protein
MLSHVRADVSSQPPTSPLAIDPLRPANWRLIESRGESARLTGLWDSVTIFRQPVVGASRNRFRRQRPQRRHHQTQNAIESMNVEPFIRRWGEPGESWRAATARPSWPQRRDRHRPESRASRRKHVRKPWTATFMDETSRHRPAGRGMPDSAGPAIHRRTGRAGTGPPCCEPCRRSLVRRARSSEHRQQHRGAPAPTVGAGAP